MPDLADRFLTSVLAGDVPGALSAATEGRARGLQVLYQEVITPALVEVGRLWHEGQISVADEHIASAIVQSVLAAQYPSFPWATGGPKGLVACVAGERHELGARMAADLLAFDGWNVTFAGADVPLEALVARIVREPPVFVGLSVALPEHLAGVREAIAALREVAPRCKLIVGGRAITLERPPDLGADLLAHSAGSAVEAIRDWKR